MKPFQTSKPLRDLSTFAIGGIADFFTEVESIEEMREVLAYCNAKALPFHIVGKGSNSLFADRGFQGLAILNKISFLEIQDTLVTVGAGYNFSHLGVKTARKGLSGLEFASGIPATVGGAIFMNAGANGAETATSLTEVSFVDEKGELVIFDRSQLNFSYRYSSFHEKKGAIVGAKFTLSPLPSAREKQLAIIDYRMKSQPYKEKSCGCVFRNPPGYSAGALIEKCGLKGMRIGDAEVSEMHANFIVNKGSATAEDVINLASEIKKCIKEKTGVELEMELRTI